MKKTDIMTMVNACTFAYVEDYGTEIVITFSDFEGFDEDWSEIENPLYDADEADTILETLANNCNCEEYGFYHKYYFDDYMVTIAYTSMDI